MQKYSLILIFISLSLLVEAQTEIKNGLDAINEKVVEAQLEFLSSDWTEGRATGSRGEYLAGDYIASMFKLYGLQPGGDMVTERYSRRERDQGKKNNVYRGFYQNFQLIEYAAGENQHLSLIQENGNSVAAIDFKYLNDFSVNPGYIACTGKADLVFAGYGLKDKEKNYDDFKEIDVKDKIILRLKGYPGHRDSESAAYKKFNSENSGQVYRASRKKEEVARELGVLAILEVDPSKVDYRSWSTNIPFRYNTTAYEADKKLKTYYDTRMTLASDSIDMSIPVFTITRQMAVKILESTGINPDEFETRVAKQVRPASEKLIGKQISFKTSVESGLINARNVIGVLKGKDTTQMIVIGGHYDHVGKYGGIIWNGADDNASGTVGVMSIAKACMETGEKPEKTIVFAAWTGEEKGLWGSKYFVEHPYNNLDMIMNLNYDMISRDDYDDKDGNNCTMRYTKGVTMLERMTVDHIKKYNIDLDVEFRPMSSVRGGSDFAPFARKGIPYFYFMAGFPPEYHQPDDHIELVNIPKMTNIIRVGFLNVWKIANNQE